MAETKDRVKELEAEVKRLKAELEEAAEHEQEFIKSRRAMLFMMEDLNATAVAVARAKKEWEATFDAISNPIFIHDRGHYILRANKAYQEAAGLPFPEIIGQQYFKVFPIHEGPFKTCIDAEGQQIEKGEKEDVYVPSLDKVFRVSFFPERDENGLYLYSVHVMEDITLAKRAEEALKEEMETTSNLLMVSEATSRTAVIDKLMEQVVQCICGIMGCNICLSYLWDSESNVFRPAQSCGLASDLIPAFKTEVLDKDNIFVKDTMERREPVIVQPGGLSQDSQLFSWLPEVKTKAVVPLFSKRRYLGLIFVVYTRTVDFTNRQMSVLQGISNQVSTALEEARLYKESLDRAMELSSKIETIQTMHEIDRNVLSTLEPKEILNTAVRMIAKVVHCDWASVLLVDAEKQGFVYAAGFGIDSLSKDEKVDFEDTNATDVFESGRAQYVANLSSQGELPSHEKKLFAEGFLSHVRVPLTVMDEAIGVLSLGSKRPSAFTPENLETLEKLSFQIGVALQKARFVEDLREMILGTVRTLSIAIDAKSTWTAGHSERVTKYSLDIAKEIGISEKDQEELELAGLLHDIGKIGTYEAILDKPGKLTEEELKIMKNHPVKGAEILTPIKQLRSIIPVIRHHHEYFNGTGYPDGIKGEEIPLLARIMTVADTVDAMSADRPYRKGRGMDVIVAELKRCSGTQFDPKMVTAFLKTISYR